MTLQVSQVLVQEAGDGLCILSGTFPIDLGKLLGEVVYGAISKLVGDGGHVPLSFPDQLLCFFYP